MSFKLSAETVLYGRASHRFSFELPQASVLLSVVAGTEVLKLWKGAKILKRLTRSHRIELVAVQSTQHFPKLNPWEPPPIDWPLERGDRVAVDVQSLASHGVARVTCVLTLKVQE